jgi:hypothetical protein
MRRAIAAGGFLVLVVFGLRPQAQQPAPAPAQTAATGVIAGRLVRVDNNQPVRKAQVSLTAPANRIDRMTTSDADGRYSFDKLPAGEYSIVASKPGYVDMVFGARRPGRGVTGTPITLVQGQKIDNVHLQMRLGSVISGTVHDEFGDPAYNTPVRALRFVYQNGFRNLTLAGSDTTDDRGAYRIAGLMPGEYLVSAVPRDTVATASATAEAIRDRFEAARKAEGFEPPPPVSRTGYVPVYFPGTVAAGSAAPVRVGLTEEVPGIDMRLQVVETATVSGRVTSTEPVLPQTRLQLFDATMPVNIVGIWFRDMRGDGTFSFPGLVPGTYVLKGAGTPGGKAGVAGGEMWGTVDVAVGDRGTANMILPMQRGVSVSANLVTDSLPPDFDSSRLRVDLYPISSPTDWEMAIFTMKREASGRFAVSHVVPGQYQVRVSGLPQGWALDSAIFEEKDTADHNLHVDGSKDVSGIALKFSSRRSEVTGLVTNPAGQPVADHTVILFPTDRRLWLPQSRRIRTSQPGKDGRYVFRDLPAGEYHVVVMLDPEPGRHFDADYLGQLVPLSISVKLGDGESRTQDIKIR